MRTTIDIDDALAIRAKKAASERRITLRQLVEEGLRLALARREQGVKSPLDELKGLGKGVWDGVDPDRYVREPRAGWS
jgi:hypothetical protein